MKGEAPSHIYKLLLVGDVGVGKSCLLKRFTRDIYSNTSNSTIGVDFSIRFVTTATNRLKLTIWDTSGHERFQALMRHYYDLTHAVVFVYDVCRRQTLKNLEEVWIPEVEQNNTFRNAVKLLVGNKIDAVDRAITTAEGMEVAKRRGCLFAEASALTGASVEEAFLTLVRRVREVPELELDAKKRAARYVRQVSGQKNRSCCSVYPTVVSCLWSWPFSKKASDRQKQSDRP